MIVTDAVLWTVALAMACASAYLIRLIVDARRPAQRAIALLLLATMGEMWIAAVVYASAPSQAALVAGLSASGVLMAVSAGVVLPSVLRPADAEAAPVGPSRAAVGWTAGIVLANEFLMGWGLLLLGGGSASSGPWGLFAAVVDSPWFLFTMAAEMLATAAFLADRLPRSVLGILIAQSVIMLFSPTALGGPVWPSLALYVSSAVMIGLIVFLLEYLYRHHQLAPALSTYVVELLAIYALMMVGLFAWLYFGDPTTFAISIVAEMAVFFAVVVRPGALSAPGGTPWLLRPNWAFALLTSVFVAEVGMGAALSLVLDPADYVGAYPFLPLAGAPATVLANAASNGFWFLATSVASTWFLVMMGLEMGVLVAFKFRETRHLENKIRLGLMLGCYAAFVVFYPSLYFGLVFPQAPDASVVPVLGWSMGIGSYPLAVGVFGAVLLTYVITGALVVLFGRRVVCSVFCAAPVMYQGTTIDAMKEFNRQGPVARKYLSSRFSTAYTVTTAAVMVALVGTSILSYLDTIGAAAVYIQGNDPSVFYFILSFSVVWYIAFVSIPYAGNYNCVTMGYCYTGTITQAFQKIGFFKLKVRNRQVCWDCPTLDCAKGCPVGLVDMVGHFRQKGEFRSTKCCGVGDCVESCPYDNLYISDVRHWVRRALGRPEVGPARPARGRAPSIGGIAVAPAAPWGASPEAMPLPMFPGRAEPHAA